MRGQLQFSTNGETYKYCGNLRPHEGRAMKIEPIEKTNKATGQLGQIGYKVTIEATTINLDSEFLSSDYHYFRIIFPDSFEMIDLSVQYYTFEKDFLLKRNNIMFHKITIEYVLKANQLGLLDVDPLPVSEGGIIIEDDDIYLE